MHSLNKSISILKALAPSLSVFMPCCGDCVYVWVPVHMTTCALNTIWMRSVGVLRSMVGELAMWAVSLSLVSRKWIIYCVLLCLCVCVPTIFIHVILTFVVTHSPGNWKADAMQNQRNENEHFSLSHSLYWINFHPDDGCASNKTEFGSDGALWWSVLNRFSYFEWTESRSIVIYYH